MYGKTDDRVIEYPSTACDSTCGTTLESQNLNCGGFRQNSVYKLGVNDFSPSIYARLIL